MACDAAGIKYIHGVEVYLTEQLDEKVRDNYHTILIAKNYQGVLEINDLMSWCDDERHKYYTGRISFDEFLSLSDNIIKTSACLASPLNKLPVDHPYYNKLVKKYDYLEVQPHNCDDQIVYNRHLAQLSVEFGKKLVAATDTHSLNQYYADCRSILLLSKHQSYGDEDKFDLTYKSYCELVDAFREQDAIPEPMYLDAIENTNEIADSVEDFELDFSLKYPILYGSKEKDREMLIENVYKSLDDKISDGVIPKEQEDGFRKAIEEEIKVFTKIEMCGFMQSMSEITRFCRNNGINLGPGRGSVCGSRIAYVTDITDVNCEQWGTVFSRFANEDRVELGDVDTDLPEKDRPKVFKYLIDRFGADNTAFVPTYGTLQSRACIDVIVRGLRHRWNEDNSDDPRVAAFLEKQKEDRKKYKKVTKETNDIDPNPYKLSFADKVKSEFEKNEVECRRLYGEVMRYYDGMLGTKVSQGVHPAGIVVSPVTLNDNYGTFHNKDGDIVLQIDMEEIHEISLVKYDFLALKTIQIIEDACSYAGIPYPRANTIDWEDDNVWCDMLRYQVGIFQMEGDFAFKLLKDFGTKSIKDMAIVTACIRPSGASYRNDLIKRIPHHNPSSIIDELLADNGGYLIFQEDTIKFLQQICGLSGSEADNVRRAIGRKDKDRLASALPQILDGYCEKSDKPREVAEEEAKEFLQILEDSASYQFGYNHSIGYCMVGFLCAWLRYYYPKEFIAAYLNNAANEADIKNGTALAREYGIDITPPRFGVSSDSYMFSKTKNLISKGVSSVKYMNQTVSLQLYNLYNENNFECFTDVMIKVFGETSCDIRQFGNLIRIGYFEEFGNVRELQRMFDVFQFFKMGAAKKYKKKLLKDSPVTELIKKYSTDVNKKGDILQTYTITDMHGLLVEAEDIIRSMGIEDADIKSKIADQQSLMGYIDLTTNRNEDRRKLLVLDLYRLYGSNGDVWGVAVTTRSIGSGKEARLTVKIGLFNTMPFKKLDVLYGHKLHKNDRGYWYLDKYEIVA